MELFLIILFSYLMGSIPFGYILTKILLKKDIREIGSGNVGATNALRTGNKIIGYGTLLLNKAMEFGDKSNCYKVILNCTKKNVGFYKLNGFISGNYEMSFLL